MSGDLEEDKPVVPGYLAPRDDAAARERENSQRTAGAVLTTGAVLGVVFVWITSNLRIHPRPGTPATLEYKLPTLVTVTAVGVIGGIGVWYWKRTGSKAFLVGAAIGLGIGVLIEGVCFALNVSR